jgi:hypothetical protein
MTAKPEFSWICKLKSRDQYHAHTFRIEVQAARPRAGVRRRRTVQTIDSTSLAVTAPTNFAGASVLQVIESWIRSDGSSGRSTWTDNVEAYMYPSRLFLRNRRMARCVMFRNRRAVKAGELMQPQSIGYPLAQFAIVQVLSRIRTSDWRNRPGVNRSASFRRTGQIASNDRLTSSACSGVTIVTDKIRSP